MHRSLTLLLSALLALALALPARAGLVRDPDIEHSLRRLAQPVLLAAGLSPSQIRVLVIEDPALNAFVADSQHIFIHSGLILKLKTAAELQAVIAHEAAHIANGHITRRVGNTRSARNAAGLGLLLAAAAAVAGNAKAAGGIAAGAAGSAQRVLFAHTRAEEASADQAGIRYLARAGIDPSAAVSVLDIFRGQEALSVGRQDPYARTHPLTRDRFRAMQGFVAAYGGKAGDPGEAPYWFARAQGKLSAFTRAPSWTLRRAASSASPDIALMRQAIAWHRQPNPTKARKAIDQLAAKRPSDPFVHELRGQILLESRDPSAAVSAYAKAVSLAPGDPLILGGLGRAQLALGTKTGNARALKTLQTARAADFRSSVILRDLAVAHARAGQTGMASLTTAERYALQGRLKDAGIHAKRAAGLLPRGSSSWRRADDIARAADAQR